MFFNKITCTERANKKWDALCANRELTISYKRMFSKNDRFFTIGSCFAEEIRKSLAKLDIKCLPNYSSIAFDNDRAIIDTLPAREHMNFYNTFSLKQEFARASEEWVQEQDDFWKIKGRKISAGNLIYSEDPTDCVYQDPYRRLMFADSATYLNSISNDVAKAFRVGIEESTAVIITLGMTEVFKKRNNGLVCNQVPTYFGGGGLRETEFYNSDFNDNIENVRDILKNIRKINSTANVILTVSPVPLHRSFGPNDVFVNNYASKCTLRAVTEQICKEYDWVHYFPSFEVVWNVGSDAYEDDLLHVKPDVVNFITSRFLKTFFN
jgi:hypothetical protein